MPPPRAFVEGIQFMAHATRQRAHVHHEQDIVLSGQFIAIIVAYCVAIAVIDSDVVLSRVIAQTPRGPFGAHTEIVTAPQLRLCVYCEGRIAHDVLRVVIHSSNCRNDLLLILARHWIILVVGYGAYQLTYAQVHGLQEYLQLESIPVDESTRGKG
ncbi:hypothetical protein ACHAW5_001462 [Stephanodiscus triporus]|uniref:Uncharacterized protein n=1 Tax=Stephanodiscus triporus TaxID=2934178 RepID=A0ABD3NDC3_9STRA